MTEQQVVELMQGSKSEAEWNDNCDTVKRAFGGGYPDFWYPAIIASGIAEKAASRFGRPSGIQVHVIK